MNKTGKTNAKKGPDQDYNAYKDFFTRETEGHIIAKWMLFAGVDDLQSKYSFLVQWIYINYKFFLV